MGEQRGGEGREEDAQNDQIAGIAGFGQREIDDAGRAQKLDGGDDQLPQHDGGSRVMQLEPARAQRPHADQAAEDVERDERENEAARRQRHFDGQELRKSLDDIRPQEQHDGREHQRAEREGEGAEGDEHAHLSRRQAFRPIRSIAHHRAGKNRGAEIVRKRIGGERAEGDEPQRDAVAEMIERQPVIGGKRRIGDKRRTDGEQPAFERNGLEARQELVERQAAQFIDERAHRNQDRRKPHNGPEICLEPFHAGASA